jgi:hypothetical protein
MIILHLASRLKPVNGLWGVASPVRRRKIDRPRACFPSKVGTNIPCRDNFPKISYPFLHCCNTRRAIEDESRLRMPSSLVIRIVEDQDKSTNKYPASNRLGAGHMDELIGRLAVKAGIDNAVAEKTIGIILGFLRNEGPSDKVQALIDKIPGAEAAIAASSNGGGLGRLMGGGLMALGTKLMGLGLGMGEIQNVARELFRFGRDKIGADQMGEIIAGTPGLSQFA